MKAPTLDFPNDETAVILMPNCRIATALREFLFEHDFHMKSQDTQGGLIIRIPADADITESKERLQILYGKFCYKQGI
jgi:hypothetical protein